MDNISDQVDNLMGASDGAADKPGESAGTAPTDSSPDSGTPSDKSAGEGEGGSKGGSESNPGGDSGDPAKGSESKDGGEPEGYVADAEDEDGEGEPSEPEKKEPSNLSPDLQYVVDNLPVLSVRGKTGENGAVKTFQVKAAGQLPEDFEFASKREELLFTQALAGQELKAHQLQSQFYQNQQSKAASEFTEKENKDIRRDIGALQREGKLNRFKLQPNDPKFTEDPAVKQAQDVIDFMNQRNTEYLEAANKGGVLYHLSFKDAYNLMQQQAPSKAPTKQQQEDRERKDVTRKGAGAASSAPTGGSKAPGFAYVGDLKDMVDMMEL